METLIIMSSLQRIHPVRLRHRIPKPKRVPQATNGTHGTRSLHPFGRETCVNLIDFHTVVGCCHFLSTHLSLHPVRTPSTRHNIRQAAMASWNSIPLEITYETFGWIAFVTWSISFYPQVILNFRRKSVVGLNFDFVVLNLTKHSSYLIYNASLYFSPVIQQEYYEKYGYGQMIPVAANDVAFSIHAVLLTAVTLCQVVIYERGDQKVSKISVGILCAVLLTVAVCVFVALPSHSWLWLISIFNSIQVFMTLIKYIPQAVMNFMRKSTAGFSIGNILLDFTGGMTNYAQMVVQSIDQNSWVNFYGNIGKTMISLVSVIFDLLFMCQHYILYPAKKAFMPPKHDKEGTEPLINSTDDTQSETV